MNFLAYFYALLVFAATASNNSILSVTAQLTIEELNAKVEANPAPPGYNIDGGSVFSNFVNAFNDGQFFFIWNFVATFEKPSSETVKGSVLVWCGDISFTYFQNSSNPGYAGRCVYMRLGNLPADLLAAGAQQTSASTEVFTSTVGISAVFVEQLNVFEGQLHKNTGDYVYRYWDNGRPSTPVIGWEGHDEGDLSTNAATSSFSGVAEFIWTSVEDVAKLLNTTAAELTLDTTFKDVYANVWIKEHEEEAAEKNPNPDSEMVIVEQVINENNGTGDADSETTNNNGSELDGNDGAASGAAEDDPSTGIRQLASVTTRLASAALRMFGI